MIARMVAPLALWAALSGSVWAVEVRPATVEEGAAVVSTEDEVITQMSPSDISILTQGAGRSTADVRQRFGASVEAWTPEETARLNAMIQRAQARLDTLSRWLPEHVLLIKNSDAMEGGLPHTRGAAILWGPSLPQDDAELDFVFFHELFHVLSRHNAARHDELYGLIGFVPCSSLTLPQGIPSRLVTNPDAPVVHWVSPAPGLGAHQYVTPILVAAPAEYTPSKPNFTDYFDLRFVRVTRTAAGVCTTNSADAPADYVTPQVAMAAMFVGAGANTGYVLHPEETLADNFAQMMTGKPDIPNPEVQARLAGWLGITPPPRQPSHTEHH